MVTEAAPGGAADLALTPEQEAYFQQHAGGPEPEQEAPEEQAEQEPVEQPEAEAVPEAPSSEAEAPSTAEEPAQQRQPPPQDKWERWVERATASINDGRPHWSEIPAEWREEVAKALDDASGKSVASGSLKAWRDRLEFTPEELEDRAREIKQQAAQETEVALQQRLYDQQVWDYFAQHDPEVRGGDPEDNFDYVEAWQQDLQRTGGQAISRYLQLKQEMAARNDPQAAARQIAEQARADALQQSFRQVLSLPRVQQVPSIRERFATPKTLAQLGYPATQEGYQQMINDLIDEAAEFHSSARATQKKAEIASAAERAAKARWRTDNTVRDGSTGTDPMPSYAPPAEAMRGGPELTKWMVANPEKYERWKAAGRPGYQGQGWTGRQATWSQRS